MAPITGATSYDETHLFYLPAERPPTPNEMKRNEQKLPFRHHHVRKQSGFGWRDSLLKGAEPSSETSPIGNGETATVVSSLHGPH